MSENPFLSIEDKDNVFRAYGWEIGYIAALDAVLAIRPIASLRVRDEVKALRKEVAE